MIRPRLNDYFDLPFSENDVEFAIPYLDEDIPLYVDPFLLWKSPSQQDNSLHNTLISSFNSLVLTGNNNSSLAIELLKSFSECNEVGLGNSKSRFGKKIGDGTAIQILDIFKNIPQVKVNGLNHIEELQLLVDNISKDRISDITCSILKSFLVDYTIEQCTKNNIPIKSFEIDIYDQKIKNNHLEKVSLPFNPLLNMPIILVPKRWLRFMDWINYEDFYTRVVIQQIDKEELLKKDKITILNYNRNNYDVVQHYIRIREKDSFICKNDPIFTPIPSLSIKRKLTSIIKLPTGKENSNDKIYEDNATSLLVSALYPKLDFAKEQSRTDSGVLIRDLIFYNNRNYNFLQDIYKDYGSKQIVFELKNVMKLEREHVNQLNRYLNDNFGKFGIFVTRFEAPKNIEKNIIDLWAGQRRCIIILTDDDLKLMVQLYESKQREPIDVIKKKYIEFIRKCPS
jgi:hypothetical protein